MTMFTLKDHFKEGRLYLNRTVTATFIVVLLLLLLAARLIFLQIYHHDLYKTLSLNNQVRIVPITPTRGLIYDRNGELLVYNDAIYDLSCIPDQVKNLDTISFCKVLGITKEGFVQRFEKMKRSKGLQVTIPNLVDDALLKKLF